MKLADRSLIKRASALALAVVLAMGLTPLPAIANTPMAVEAASDRAEAIFPANTSLTVDGNVEGSNNTFSVNGSVGHKVVSKGEGNSRSYDLVQWTQAQTTRKVISTGHIDLRNPEADYEPATATKRSTPIQANTYYDYTVWLDPTYYTVQPGHRLQLYIVPFLNYNNVSNDGTVDPQLAKMGLDASALMHIRTNYSFTIDNANSYATLPLTSAWKVADPASPPAAPEPVDISGAAVARIATKTYTGKAIKPSPAITYADKQLVRGVDYDLLYKANVKVGTAKVAIVGKGAYTGSKTVKFKIKKASVKKAKAKKLKARKYTGRAIKPKPKLTYKGKKLKAGRDYKLTYKNNKFRGVAKIIVKGKGNFKGKKVVKFRIR